MSLRAVTARRQRRPRDIGFTGPVVNASATRLKENHARNLKPEARFAPTLQRYRKLNYAWAPTIDREEVSQFRMGAARTYRPSTRLAKRVAAEDRSALEPVRAAISLAEPRPHTSRAPCWQARHRTFRVIGRVEARLQGIPGYDSAKDPTLAYLTAAPSDILSLERANKDWVPLSPKKRRFLLPFAKPPFYARYFAPSPPPVAKPPSSSKQARGDNSSDIGRPSRALCHVLRRPRVSRLRF
jgi:hypothetical protein